MGSNGPGAWPCSSYPSSEAIWLSAVSWMGWAMVLCDQGLHLGTQGKLLSLAGLMGCLMPLHTQLPRCSLMYSSWRCSVCVCQVANGEKQRASQGSKALCPSHSLASTSLPQLAGASRESLRFHRACGRRKQEGAACPCEVSLCFCF